MPLAGMPSLLRVERSYDGNNQHVRSLRWKVSYRNCERVVHDLFATIHPGSNMVSVNSAQSIILTHKSGELSRPVSWNVYLHIPILDLNWYEICTRRPESR